MKRFYAISGEGAYMNGNAIHVSKDDLANSMFCLVHHRIIRSLRRHPLN